MIQKYLYGVPFDTESVVAPIPASQGEPPVGTVKTSESGFCFACPLAESDRVYGLGEANRGINKRGFVYVSDNVDDGLHTENKQRMYAAHNFIVISGQQNLGLFFDYPARIRFDIGFTRRDWLEVTCERADLALYVITGDSACDEGKEKGYFCKRADGTDFEGTVWPGWSHFPDVLNPEARAWFGSQYKALTDCGIEGFWNDMNEPAIFYSREGLAERLDHPPVPHEDGTIDHFGQAIGWLNLSNAPEDYARFYHKVDGKMVRHDQVHNLYGYNMTRAASEGLASIAPGKRFLLFSRSSCIGMHRYGGVWTGDNHSWWSHLLLNLKMLPSLNMCGFLYVGADLGGFNADTSRDLLLRWLALGVFTPLMRNHSGSDTRRQEFYQFEGPEDFRSVIETRYRLIPYLYSEYMKAALNGDMLFKPLAFVYPEDEIALQTEDQLMLGNEVMIAPVYTQNATGRMVYLPEEMLFVKFGPEGRITQEVLPAGTHFVKVALNEVPLFIRKGACIPVADPAQTVADIDPATIRMIGWPGASYDRYDDDGVTFPAE